MVSWIPNNGGTTREVRDNNMFMLYGFFFFALGKIVTCDHNKKQMCKEVFINDHKWNEFKKWISTYDHIDHTTYGN